MPRDNAFDRAGYVWVVVTTALVPPRTGKTPWVDCRVLDRYERDAVLRDLTALQKQLDASEGKTKRRAKEKGVFIDEDDDGRGWKSLWDKPRAERPGWRERLAAASTVGIPLSSIAAARGFTGDIR
jgi:hypothetical protein